MTASRNESAAPSTFVSDRAFPIALRLLSVWLLAALLSPSLGLAAERVEPLEILEKQVAAGEKQKLSFLPVDSFEGAYIDVSVHVVRGTRPGPVLCATAGIHGDEINGPEIARRVFMGTDAASLKGTLIVVPTLNAYGFRTGNRYLPDRRDLNRAFPGNRNGSLGAIIANAVFSRVIRKCDALFDLHTGSFHRSNLPQIRVDITNEAAFALARAAAVGVVIDGKGPRGSLRREAVEAGIPAIIYEAGGPHRFETEEIERGVQGVRNVMAYLGLIDLPSTPPSEPAVYLRTRWLRVPVANGGLFFPEVELGAVVREGDRLGRIVDADDDEEHPILSPLTGHVIGMATPQVVLSGYGLFHLGFDETQPGDGATGSEAAEDDLVH